MERFLDEFKLRRNLERNPSIAIKIRNHYVMWVVTPTYASPINWSVTLKSIHKNKNTPSDIETHLPMIKRQRPTKASNNDSIVFESSYLYLLCSPCSFWASSKTMDKISFAGIYSTLRLLIWLNLSFAFIYLPFAFTTGYVQCDSWDTNYRYALVTSLPTLWSWFSESSFGCSF